MFSILINGVRRLAGSARGIFLTVVFLSGIAVAQEDMESLSADGLLAEAGNLLSLEKYDDAVPYMTEYLTRMWGMEDVRVRGMMQEVRLKLAKVKAFQGDQEVAVDYLKEYTQEMPLLKPREAYKIMALNQYALGEYESCISNATYALTEPLPKELEETKKTVVVEELSKEERGGYSVRQLKRIEKAVKEAGTDLSEGFSAKKVAAEPEYTIQDKVLLHLAIAESHTAREEWADSVPAYQYIIDNSVDESRKGYSIMQMVNAMIKLEKFNDASVFVQQLYRTNARYDIRVNMALISTASALFNVDEYDSALTLYRMILPRNALVSHLEGQMNEICREKGLPDISVSIGTNDTGRIETQFGYKYSKLEASYNDKMGIGTSGPVEPPKLKKMKAAIETLVSLPPYEEDVRYRMGELYTWVGRPWEAVVALSQVASRDPDSARGLQAFCDALSTLAEPLEEYGRVESLGKQFLDSHTEGVGPRQVAHVLVGCYQKQGFWKDVKKLIPYMKGFDPSDDPTVLKYECELWYMQAIADMVLLDYKGARDGFQKILTDYPSSHQEENARYWHAMSQLFLQDHQTALDELNAYAVQYPTGSWAASASFHSGICLFGLEKYSEAKERFTHVIQTWPDSSIYPDACSLRGDLLAAEGKLTDAQADYEEAIAKATAVRQATYAVFQMSSMFEMEERYDEILTAVNSYLDSYAEEADVAKAAYWIGKTKLQQGLVAEAVEAYRETIVKYGWYVDQEGVDLIINELVAIARNRLTDQERDALTASLRDSLQATDHVALQLRLRVLLATLDGTQVELGKELLAELKDFEQASPPVLAVICDASLTLKDYSRAEEILDIFRQRYDESEFMGAALKLRGFGFYADGQYDEALKIAVDAQSRYGTASDVAWAQIMKGKIELQQGRFDAARKTFEAAITVREWRGEPYAEATYMLGKVEEAAGDPRQAFGWYQRVYVLYKGYAHGYWAAEAYLSSADCLEKLGLENDRRNTYRAMLFDKYVNKLPQAETAQAVLGAEESVKINQMIASGMVTNIAVNIEEAAAVDSPSETTGSKDAEVTE